MCARGTIGGGGALVVVERWNINATLPLISLHLSPTCPLRVSPSKSMNRHSSDINRQLVCSVFQRQNTKTSLAPIFFPSSPFFFFCSEKHQNLIFTSSRQSHRSWRGFHPQFNAQTETSPNLSVQRAAHQSPSLLAAGHLCLCVFFCFVFF